MSLKENINKIKADIADYKTVSTVQLIAVTKYLSIQETENVVSAGLLNLGENRIQNALPKIETINNNNVTWHYMGRIQKNKAKKIVANFKTIHSIADWETLDKIDSCAKELKKNPVILLQVNTSGEEAKQGFEPNNLTKTIKNIHNYKNIMFKGYMTMAPFVDNPEMVRPYFKKLKDLAELLKKEGIPYEELSMGMSNDYKVALKEGATMVRIGTKLYSGE